MASAVRVLYPALADGWRMSASQIGLLYAAIPLGGSAWGVDQRSTGANGKTGRSDADDDGRLICGHRAI